MATSRRSSCGTALFAMLVCVSSVDAQRLVPLAGRSDEALLPAGITEFTITLNGQLGYVFKDEDGTDVVHLVGDSKIRLGEPGGQELRAREAVVWINHREHASRRYRHYQIMLWQDAEVDEIGSTYTAGPALFVTLNSFGPLVTEVDEFTHQTSFESQAYQDGNIIRKAVNAGVTQSLNAEVSMQILDPTGIGHGTEPEIVRPVITFRSEGEIKGPIAVGELRAITVIGGVYLARGTPGANDYFEIRADSAVVFLPQEAAEEMFPMGGAAGEESGSAGEEPGEGTPAAAGLGDPERRRSRERRRTTDGQTMSMGMGDLEVDSVYLEGDVIMTQGPNMIRADRLYYEFDDDRALILDAVVRAMIVDRGLPLYLRAAEIRQLSANQFSASSARLTTSEFHTPHYHVGASRVELTNRTPPDPSGRPTGVRAGSFRIDEATLNVGGQPIAYWPFIQGDVDTSETAIQALRLGYSDDFGVEIETRWNFFNLLGLETPEGVAASLNLDYFSERGPGAGLDIRYERDRYYGHSRSYLMHDDGEDNLGEDREKSSPHEVRGRFLARHRQYLEDDWELTLEFSFLSDRNFLEEFFESEFENDKEQETLLRLKKQRDNWAFTATMQARLHDFFTQTERFPDLAFFVVGESVGDRLTWFSENRLGVVRYRPADQSFEDFLNNGSLDSSSATGRVDTRQEIDVPLDIGPLRLVPFVTGRASAWDDSPEDGGIGRGFGAVGVRGSMYFWKLYPDRTSELLDINGLRHIIKPDITAWLSAANRDPEDLYPFDDTVEGVEELDGVTIGLRQRWQTKRGSGENRRTVDFFTFNVEAGVFNDASGDEITNGYASYSRPENSVSRNFINTSSIWRLNDRTALISEASTDLNDGKLDIYNLSVVVERPPRLSYLIGYRFINDTDSNLLGFDLNYQLNEKHTFALRERFDLDRGRTLDLTVALIRRLPRWFAALSFELDEAEDDFGVSFSLWPEGLPKAALGSRRFTGLGGNTQLSND